ncbi:uncharacterized protein LOC116264511 [Nymphaea colorata]|uniref:uncharacterized protein LOC116264511 n=1 Tax=Nymphaea colorata TaxID=210225 RepID=UPI00129E3D2F|nr:uncharacterized protein LOC116264511 [Nymphaea colorata]
MAVRLHETVLRGLRGRASRDIFSSSSLLNRRNMSSGSSRKKKEGDKNGSGLAEFIEIKVSEGSVLDEEVKRLEDAIYAFMVRQAAPAWLPFRPGFSYWVPPRESTSAAAASMNITNLIGGMVHLMTVEESLSLTTARGWPSYVYYVEGASTHSGEVTSKSAESDEDEG